MKMRADIPSLFCFVSIKTKMSEPVNREIKHPVTVILKMKHAAELMITIEMSICHVVCDIHQMMTVRGRITRNEVVNQMYVFR